MEPTTMSIFVRPPYILVVMKFIMLNKDLLYEDYIEHSKLYACHQNMKINIKE